MTGTETAPAELFTPEFFQDPQSFQAELRADTPARAVVTPNGFRVWIVSRYEEAKAVLADPTVQKNSAGMREAMAKNKTTGAEAREFAPDLSAHMLSMDPPDHTRLRRLVTKAFTARRIEQMRPRIEEITAELLGKLSAGDEVDLLDVFAFPLPITVISELLGVDDEDREQFRRASNTLIASSGPEETQQAGQWMAGYFAKLIAAKRANPGEDLLSALIETSEDSDRFSEQELVSMAFLLLVAGHETTVNLIGNGMLALLTNPEQLALLQADPSLMASAVDEFLRFRSPVNMSTFRFTTEPVVLGEVTIPAESMVLVGLGSANRDENHFEHADQLDITRPVGGHLAFGHGIHYCLGAPLARLEGEIAFRGLLKAFPDMKLAASAAELQWRISILIHGLEKLPVVL
ncbi:cytochrome P450 family protein [Kutzneria sp. CA-103260]|uniref:cytochrome P450 family protein n=1 Tax=Kutzneria sp. CA-103260 TaxID=2802641 RepID=UPI001BAD4266|nr:cytochrome P450 [Kutzneria sp. CA-103260]QUQ71725.1 cytochrome P450 [Kutzneria sp. CA-103260]